MHTKRSLRILLILATIFLSKNIEARKVSGYIITNTSDTIVGALKASHFNIITGEYLFSEICTEPYHIEIFFRAKNSRKYINYKPSDIIEFGYLYKDKIFIYMSFIIKSNTTIKKDKERFRFLNLSYTGEIQLFKEIIRVKKDMIPNEANKIIYEQTYTYFDYYLYNQEVGLRKVEYSDGIDSLSDLLKLYGVENEYLVNLPSNVRLKDIKSVLSDYDSWKRNHIPITISL